MARRIVFSPEARADLRQLYLYIAGEGGPDRAGDDTGRILAYCKGFTEFPERGADRSDLRPGLRIVGFERRVSIAFHVTPDSVVFDRILYGGRDIERAFEP